MYSSYHSTSLPLLSLERGVGYRSYPYVLLTWLWIIDRCLEFWSNLICSHDTQPAPRPIIPTRLLLNCTRYIPWIKAKKERQLQLSKVVRYYYLLVSPLIHPCAFFCLNAKIRRRINLSPVNHTNVAIIPNLRI